MGFPSAEDERREHLSGSRDSLLRQEIGVTLGFEDGSEVGLGIVEDVLVDEHEEGLGECERQ